MSGIMSALDLVWIELMSAPGLSSGSGLDRVNVSSWFGIMSSLDLVWMELMPAHNVSSRSGLDGVNVSSYSQDMVRLWVWSEAVGS